MGRTVASRMGRTLSRLTLNGLLDITASGRGAVCSPQARFREEGFMRRTVQVGLSLLAVLVLLVSVGGTASAHQAGTTYLKVKGAHSPNHPHQSGNLFYHGGAIEQAAKVYIVWWGSQWASSGAAQTYVSNFFSGVGGSSWANSTTQYCQGVPSGTVQCGSSGTHPTNPTRELGGTWSDTSNVPTSPTQSQIAAEASALAAHFGGVSTTADYMVFTPSGHSENGFGAQWCAYHSSSGNLSYSSHRPHPRLRRYFPAGGEDS